MPPAFGGQTCSLSTRALKTGLLGDRQHGSSATLTSWKEIAQYLGKGVRTVQRWEKTLHLPVRRPNRHARGIVCAVPNEIDLWLQSRFTPNGENSKSELDKLRERIAELLAENQSLRRELELNGRPSINERTGPSSSDADDI